MTIGVHAPAGGVLMLLASGFAGAGAWTGVAGYGVLGRGTALAPILPVLGSRSWGRGLGGPRVLAVDDNATNRTIVREQLAAGGLSVTTVADGQSALERLCEAALNGR